MKVLKPSKVRTEADRTALAQAVTEIIVVTVRNEATSFFIFIIF